MTVLPNSDDIRKAVVDSLSNPSEDIARHVLSMAGANPNQIEKAITTGTGLVAYDLQAPAKNLLYVTPQVDARCVVPNGFVRLHDAAAASVDVPAVPDSASEPVDKPSGIELSAIARTVAGNYGLCNGFREQLIGWQQWYVGQRAAEQHPLVVNTK